MASYMANVKKMLFSQVMTPLKSHHTKSVDQFI